MYHFRSIHDSGRACRRLIVLLCCQAIYLLYIVLLAQLSRYRGGPVPALFVFRRVERRSLSGSSPCFVLLSARCARAGRSAPCARCSGTVPAAPRTAPPEAPPAAPRTGTVSVPHACSAHDCHCFPHIAFFAVHGLNLRSGVWVQRLGLGLTLGNTAPG